MKITFIDLQRQIKEQNEYILNNEKKYEELKIKMKDFKEKGSGWVNT